MTAVAPPAKSSADWASWLRADDVPRVRRQRDIEPRKRFTLRLCAPSASVPALVAAAVDLTATPRCCVFKLVPLLNEVCYPVVITKEGSRTPAKFPDCPLSPIG